MIVQPSNCEICGRIASGKIRVELIEARTPVDVQYIHGVTHARCVKHQFGAESVSLYGGYDYVEVEEGEAV